MVGNPGKSNISGHVEIVWNVNFSVLNEVLLKHSHSIHLLTVYPCFGASELSSCDRDYVHARDKILIVQSLSEKVCWPLAYSIFLTFMLYGCRNLGFRQLYWDRIIYDKMHLFKMYNLMRFDKGSSYVTTTKINTGHFQYSKILPYGPLKSISFPTHWLLATTDLLYSTRILLILQYYINRIIEHIVFCAF